MQRIRALAVAAAAVLSRPKLWPTALRQLFVLAPTGWQRQWPYLPFPDRSYLRFRLETAYGDPKTVPPGSDVVAYLSWCRRNRR
jgi:hypothetical protein